MQSIIKQDIYEARYLGLTKHVLQFFNHEILELHAIFKVDPQLLEDLNW